MTQFETLSQTHYRFGRFDIKKADGYWNVHMGEELMATKLHSVAACRYWCQVYGVEEDNFVAGPRMQ
jgi:hypothetical protein